LLTAVAVAVETTTAVALLRKDTRKRLLNTITDLLREETALQAIAIATLALVVAVTTDVPKHLIWPWPAKSQQLTRLATTTAIVAEVAAAAGKSCAWGQRCISAIRDS
jgi:translation initiation factor 6 (eIF-6)